MDMFAYEKEHRFENDILYKGYNGSNSSKVCFNYYFENSLDTNDLKILKSCFSNDNYGKTGFWFDGKSQEIFCNLLNKGYSSLPLYGTGSKDYAEAVHRLWISMWNSYYDSINLQQYYEIVDNLFLQDNNNLTLEEKLFIYISTYENCNFNYFNYQSEKILWKNTANNDFKKFVISQQEKNNNNLSKIFTEYKNAGNKFNFSTVYRLTSFKDFLSCLLHELIENNVPIKKCLNCGKYFSPKTRSETFYCDNASPQDSTKTCKEYGAIKTYQENLKNDETKGLYRRIYMKKQMRAKRYPDISSYIEDFENFKIESKRWKKMIKDNKSLQDEYLEWLRKENYTN